MAYEPTEWKSGDVVTSAKLNKLENGVAGAGGVLIVEMSMTTGDHSEEIYTLNKTWKEIHDAFVAGVNVLISTSEGAEHILVVYVGNVDGVYTVDMNMQYGVSALTCESENGYPTYVSN